MVPAHGGQESSQKGEFPTESFIVVKDERQDEGDLKTNEGYNAGIVGSFSNGLSLPKEFKTRRVHVSSQGSFGVEFQERKDNGSVGSSQNGECDHERKENFDRVESVFSFGESFGCGRKESQTGIGEECGNDTVRVETIEP